MAIHSPVITGLPASSGMRERLIVALDVSSADEAQKLVARIGDAAGIYKVGLQLFTSEGPGIVRDLVSSGRRVFLDLKLHDIPTTVALAVKSAAELRVDMLTIHASGGAAMLRAATEAAAGRMNLLAVTVLTSLNDEDMQEIGVSGRVSDQVSAHGLTGAERGLPGNCYFAARSFAGEKSLGRRLCHCHTGYPSGRRR